MEALERLKIELMAEGIARMAIALNEKSIALITETILNEAEILPQIEKIAYDIMSEVHAKDQHKISEKTEKLKEVIKHQKKILEIIG